MFFGQKSFDNLCVKYNISGTARGSTNLSLCLIPLCTYVHALVERILCSFFLAESSMRCPASKPCCHPV